MNDSQFQKYRYPLLALLVLMLAVLGLVTWRGAQQDREPAAQEAAAQAAEVEEPVPEAVGQEPAATATETATAEATAEPTEEAIKAEEPPLEAAAAPELEDYVSATGFFTSAVPAGWGAQETFPGGALVMASSEEALQRFQGDGAIEQGDQVLNIGFLPYELFRQREVVPLNIQFEATPDLFLQSLLPMFRVAQTAAVSDPELISLSSDRDAGMLTIAEEGREGLIVMFIAGDEVVGVVSAVGFPGEGEALQEVSYAVAAETMFTGAQGALYGALLEG